MKIKIRQILSLVLAVIMFISVMPDTVSASLISATSLTCVRSDEKYSYVASADKDGDTINFRTHWTDDDEQLAVYCVQRSKEFNIEASYSDTTWSSNAMYSEIAYAIYHGCSAYGDKCDSEYSAGGWIKDYYITQVVIWCILDDYGRDGVSVDDLIEVSEYSEVYDGIIALYNAAKSNAGTSGYGDTVSLEISPSSLSMTLNSSGTYYTTGWFSIETEGDVISSEITLSGAPSGTEIIYEDEDDPESRFKIRLSAETAQALSLDELSFTVKVSADYQRAKSCIYTTSDGDDQNVTILQWDGQTSLSDSASVSLTLETTAIEIYKTDSDTGESVEGVTYKVYSDYACTDEVAVLGPTDEDGYAYVEFTMHQDTYYVKEYEADDMYIVDTQAYTVSVAAGSTSRLNTENEVKRGGVSVQKLDAETESDASLGSASLEGAVYEIVNLTGDTIIVNDTSYENGEAVAYLTTDENGYAQTADDLLPYGHYSLQEIEAPEGYTMDETVYEFDITDDSVIVSAGETDDSHTTAAVHDTVIRTDIELEKKDSENNVMTGIPFLITSQTTGESHVVVTDTNGYICTSSDFVLHSENTNIYDSIVITDSDGSYAVDEEMLAYLLSEYGYAGVWFAAASDGSTVEVDDTLGALPYDTYTIIELPCDANSGKELVEAYFTVNESYNSLTINYGTLVDNIIYEPYIETDALDWETNSHYAAADDEVIIVDTVSCYNLTEGETYTIKGILMDRDTGEAVTDDEGNTVTASCTFTAPSAGFAQKELEYTFSAEGMDGMSVVVFVYLYDSSSDEEYVASHEDLTDEDQTIYFPAIETLALDEDTAYHLSKADDEVVITDTISYSNVRAGYKHKITGTLIDQETGSPLLDDNGNEITAEVIFTPEEAEGQVEVTFTFSASDLAGKTAVVYEELWMVSKNILYATHEDIADEEQTIHFPEITTLASDSDTEINISCADETVTITDTVSYENLIAGETYTIRGVLMDQETGEKFEDADGNAVTASALFTADESSGTVDVIYEFDASGLDGQTFVVFEYLYWSGYEIASHEDITDAGQTVRLPKISTEAFADELDEACVYNEDGTFASVTITDTVAYENLWTSAELSQIYGERDETDVNTVYTLKGSLVYQETGEYVFDSSGNAVSVSKTFKASSSSGEVTLKFELDLSEFLDENGDCMLEGAVTVVFEELYLGASCDEEMIVAEHKDTEDAQQDIRFPKGQTHANDITDSDVTECLSGEDAHEHKAYACGSVRIIDRVYYESLHGGTEYTINGTLMDKDTGEALTDDDGNEIVSTTVTDSEGNVISTDGTFTTDGEYDDSVSGYVYLLFEFSGELLAGRTAVAFETISREGKDVIVHADISDGAQTVHFPAISTTAGYVYEGESLSDFHLALADSEITLYDVVYYENLKPGETYTLLGVLTDKETGDPLTIDGEEITCVQSFTVNADGTAVKISGASADASGAAAYDYDENEDYEGVSGSVELEFTFNSSELEEHTLVVYETLYSEGISESGEPSGKVLALHENISDEEQIVHIPGIHTTALDLDTGDSAGSIWGALINSIRSLLGSEDADGNGIADDRQQSIVDTVTLTNLVPGKTYTITGTLYDSETGEPLLINGEEITQEAVIKAGKGTFTLVSGSASNLTVTAYSTEDNSISGTIDLTFIFDSSLLNNEGTTIVVGEELYYQGILIGIHNDMSDEGQSINEAGITTTAIDACTGSNTGSVSEKSVITDKVNLAKLVEGMEYTVTGYLIDLDSSSGDSINYILDENGDPVTVSCTFTASSDDENFTVTETDGFSVNGTLILTFDISSADVEGKTVTAEESLYHNDVLITSHGVTVNEDGSLYAEESQTVFYPTGKTNATDTVTGTHTSYADGERTITDSFYFQNLIDGNTYELTGILYDQETGEAIDGEGAAQTITFTASEDMSEYGATDVEVTVHADGTRTISGYIPVTFTVDLSDYAGSTFTAGETLYYKGKEIFTHFDLTDSAQTIKVPAISTQAHVDELDEASVYNEDGSYARVTITDTVTCENLWTNAELEEMQALGLTINGGSVGDLRDGTVYYIEETAAYVLKGTLIVRETGEPLTDTDGNEIISYAQFSPQDEDGSCDVVFELDLNDFLNEDGSCSLEGITLTVYEELYIGSIEDITGSDNASESDDSYDGDASDEGYVDNYALLIARHSVIDDTLQDIRFPAAQTHANDLLYSDTGDDCDEDEASNEHEILASDNIQIIDKVSYENLHGGTVYTIYGVLMDKETGEALTDDNGNEITSSVVVDAEGNVISSDGTFTTDGEYDDEVSGEVYLLFTFSGELLAGKTAVIFENISREGKDVIVHADLSDKAQTVYFPKLQTKAADGGTGTSKGTLGKTTIKDTVSYKNLTAGDKYTVSGVLMEKTTGEALKDENGDEITASATFTALEGGSGEVILTYELDSESLAGKSVVVFEELYKDGKLTARHADINDTAQTISYPDYPKTSDIPVMPFAAAAAAVAILAGAFIRRRGAGTFLL